MSEYIPTNDDLRLLPTKMTVTLFKMAWNRNVCLWIEEPLPGFTDWYLSICKYDPYEEKYNNIKEPWTDYHARYTIDYEGFHFEDGCFHTEIFPKLIKSDEEFRKLLDPISKELKRYDGVGHRH